VFAAEDAGGEPDGPGSGPFNLQTSQRSDFSSTLKRVTAKVANAPTIEPKVVPADDPVRLSSGPDRIGAEVYWNAGRVYESRGNLRAAMAQYGKALETTPDHVATLVSLARLHDRRGQFDEAITLYQRAMKADPNNASALNDLGLCHARKGDHQDSLAALSRAVQLQPTRTLYRNNIATVLVKLGQPDDALAHLSAVHPLGVAHYNTGCLLHRNGQPALAIQHLTRALQYDPTLVPARRMLTQIGAPRPRSLANHANREGG
jgi:tetratricopeptide (TPR) repeat protein